MLQERPRPTALSLALPRHRHPPALTPPPQLSQSEFEGWYAQYQKASAAIHGRAEAIADAAEKIERDLMVVGTTAIEDKLQVGRSRRRGEGKQGGGRRE